MKLRDNDLDQLSRRDRLRILLPIALLLAVVIFASFHYLQPAPPRHIVLASGAEFGMYHRFAQRYRSILGRDGVSVEERMTSGAAENLELLRDPHSRVDVALLQGGIARAADTDKLVMLATLYYEPLWIFYRDRGTPDAAERARRQAAGGRLARQRHACLRAAAARRE